MFKIGYKVKLKDYSNYSDWQRHSGEIATILEKYTGSMDWDYRVMWENGDTSCVHKNNLVHVEKEWDEVTNV